MTKPAMTIQLSELLGALSTALDLTEGQPVGHGMRSCWIGTHIGIELGMTGQSLHDLYYAILLKDIGCTSNAARMCELFLADDILFKRDFMGVNNRSLPKGLRFLLSHTGVGLDFSERVRSLISAIRHKDDIAQELVDTRCTRGAEIVRGMRFNDVVANAILSLDEHWDGGGHPRGLKGNDIPMESQIALLSQVVDVIARAEGAKAAIKEVARRSGKWFNPQLVKLFRKVAQNENLWAVWASPDIETHLFALEPAQARTVVDEDYLDAIAHWMAVVVDTKSPYTYGHSQRVTLFTDLIAKEMGLTKERRRWLGRAALLHDIGKLGVSNKVLDKPGKLDADEWDQVKMHPVYSHNVLARVAAFAELAPVAASHHERLDGKGYPHGISADQITLETRIITVADIYDALTAERPYRAAMSKAEAMKIMDGMVGTQISADCYAALKKGLRDRRHKDSKAA